MMEPKNYNETLNLPKTDFPMRGNLPENEPKIFNEVFETMMVIGGENNEFYWIKIC